MQRIPNIKLTQDDFEKLLEHKIIGSGSEATICRTEKQNTVYKIFCIGKKVFPMPDNKVRKIDKLYQMSLEHITSPISTISLDGTLIGYEMIYDSEDKTFNPFALSNSEVIHFLKGTKDILEQLASKDITYGDVAGRNILINHRTGTIKFCDIDNMRVGEYPIDLIGNTLQKYTKVRGVDAATDAYMHSIMTLNSFDLDEDECSQEEFAWYFTREGRKILHQIREKTAYNGEYIVQYVKKK